MQGQLGENALVDDPPQGSLQCLEGHVLGSGLLLPALVDSFALLRHFSQTPFKLNRVQFDLLRGVWLFLYSLIRVKPGFYRLKIVNGVALRGRWNDAKSPKSPADAGLAAWYHHGGHWGWISTLRSIIMRHIVLLGLMLASSGALATERVVWQIGRPDRNYAELAFAGDHAACAKHFGAQPVVFEIGRSDPARDWPFIQPGPNDTWWAAAGKPWTIRFTLRDQPQGTYTLCIGLVDTQGDAPPRYVVTVGGHPTEFQLTAGGGDASLTNPHAGKPQRLKLTIPARFLKHGINEIQLTCARAPGSCTMPSHCGKIRMANRRRKSPR